MLKCLWHDLTHLLPTQTNKTQQIMYVQIVGIISSVLTAVSMIPQLIKVIKEKDAENLSILMLCVLLSGLGMWVYYGVLIKDPIIIISNSFSVLLNLGLLFCAIRFKR